MAETTTDPGTEPQAGTEPEPKQEQEPKPPWGSSDEFDPEKAWKLIQDLRADKDKLKSARDELQGKVQEFADRDKTEAQRAAEAKEQAAKDAANAKAEAARLRVALRKGLTETQAKRLVGDTEEDLDADADELLASFRSDDGQEPPRQPRERLRPGAAPSSEPELDPKEVAAAIDDGGGF